MNQISADELLPEGDKYKFIFDNITETIVLCDEDGSIIKSNRASDVIFGKGEPLSGRKCYEVFRSQTRKCPDCPLKPTLESGAVVPLVSYDRRFGEYFEENTYPLLDEDEEVRGYVLTCRNVSKTKAIEEKSAQMKKLSALGKISSGVAHDFNNILTVVLGRIQLMKRDVSNPRLLESLNLIEKAANDGAEKVRKIRDFARPGSAKANRVPVDVAGLINEVIDLTRPKWEEASKIKGILINPLIELKDNLIITGNASDLRNAFTNIIFNAVDAMPDGGVITFRSIYKNKNVYIDIQDTGTGMTEETVEKVFDPFFTTKGVLGTGMGMSEVYGIIKRHNGSISVSSQVGRGTTFSIRLPGEEIIKEVSVKPDRLKKDSKIKMLIIESDDYKHSFMYDCALEKGYDVAAVANRDEALARIKNEDFLVVVTDLDVPRMTGVDIAHQVKKINKNIQVVLFSNLALAPDESKYFDTTVDFIVNNMYSESQINYVLEKAIENIHYLKKN